MPTSRFYEEGAFSFSLYDGTPDQKITMTAQPYDWFEASVFYTNIQGKPYPGFKNQDYKDKGFNFKIRLKEEGRFPAIAIGMNDIAGTGFYSSEYIVSSYGINDFDFHLGLGWGTLNGYRDFNNPLTQISDKFRDRPEKLKELGGSIDFNRYFSGDSISPFFGISYALNKNLVMKLERDTTLTPGKINYQNEGSQISFGLDYSPSKNFTLGIGFERNNFFSVRFTYKGNKESRARYEYEKNKSKKSQNRYSNFINSLNNNGIGVNKLVKNGDSLGIELTQFQHPAKEILEEIIFTAKAENDIDEEIIANYKIADLDVVQNFDQSFESDSEILFERKKQRNFNTNTNLSIRPFIAGREGFLKFAALLENNSEFVIRDNLIFSSNLKYSIWDNFDELYIPPEDTYPAQVRSDVKDYLNNFGDGVIVGRAQIDFYKTIKPKNHIMLTAGILEEMFQGYGFEYLWFDNSKNYAVGFEVFDVQKRAYNLRFDTLDYRNTTGHINFYYRNYNLVPFDAKLSYGEYLAGDVGSTIELSRSFQNGIRFGFFASSTDVSSEQFGEGSFDKGIFFDIPIFGNLVNYSWRPLTKDPAQKLIRKNNLHDLLVKFKPLN